MKQEIKINENSSRELKNLSSGLSKLRDAAFNKKISGLIITEAEIAAILLCCDKELFDDKGEMSDGYHTFNELYEHRHLLFLNLVMSVECRISAKLDHYPDWDCLLMELWSTGEQISYHLPTRLRSLWIDYVDVDAEQIVYDGHTSQDVLERLKRNL